MLQELVKKLPASRRKEAERYLSALIQLGPVESSKLLTWSDVFEEMPFNQGEGPKLRVELCNHAAKLLKRPPTLEDFETDFLFILFKKIGREYSGDVASKGVYLRRRLDLLKRFSAYCSTKYKVKAIDWQGFLLSRRAELDSEIRNADMPTKPAAAAVLDAPVTIDEKYRSVLLSDVVAKYIDERLMGKSHNSKRLLIAAERKFSQYLTRPALLPDLNTDTLSRYLAYLLRGKSSRRTVLCNQERLNSLWRYASKKGWLNTEPDLPLVTIPERIPDAFSAEEMAAILKAAESVPGNMPGVMSKVPYALYWKALILFLDDTVERIGGVLEVTFADVASRNGEVWVTVRAEGRKGKTRDKQFKLRPETHEAIKQLRKLTDAKEVERVFHWPLNRTYLWAKFKAVLAAADIPDHRRNKFHKFRRTTATEFEAAGGNASKLLDHRNRATTAKYLDTRRLAELMPADVVAPISERGKAAGSQEKGSPGGKSKASKQATLAQMRALLESLEQ